MKRPSYHGFTLLELLVVISVIAVLAALLFSVFPSVSAQGKQARSMQNLKTIGVGLAQYVGEHGHLPESAISCTFQGKSVNFWYNAIGTYIEGDGYLDQWEKRAERPRWQECPGRPFEQFATLWSRGISVGYGWNHLEFGYDGQEASKAKYGFAFRPQQVSHPAATVIIGTNRETNDAGIPIPYDSSSNVLVYRNKPDSSRFNGAGLYLMLDGHIERLTPADAAANDSYLFRRIK